MVAYCLLRYVEINKVWTSFFCTYIQGVGKKLLQTDRTSTRLVTVDTTDVTSLTWRGAVRRRLRHRQTPASVASPPSPCYFCRAAQRHNTIVSLKISNYRPLRLLWESFWQIVDWVVLAPRNDNEIFRKENGHEKRSTRIICNCVIKLKACSHKRFLQLRSISAYVYLKSLKTVFNGICSCSRIPLREIKITSNIYIHISLLRADPRLL